MDTYFVRHTDKLGIDEESFDKLLKKKLIFIHFPFKNSTNEEEDCISLNPDDYMNKTAKRAIGCLKKLAEDGGYVCAEYRTLKGAIVGKVEPGTSIELNKEGRWRSQPNRIAVLKTLSLTKIKEIEPGKYSKFSFGRPIHGTICQWRNVKERIECLVDDKPLEPILKNLSPAQLEVLCSEYLRSGKHGNLPQIGSFLLPVGRTLKDIDIAGITETGEIVYSQVTYKNIDQSKEKLDKLKKYQSNDSHLIFFCDVTEPQQDGCVSVYPIDMVFEEYCKTPLGKKWLNNVFE
jgi:hypothetical protein